MSIVPIDRGFAGAVHALTGQLVRVETESRVQPGMAAYHRGVIQAVDGDESLALEDGRAFRMEDVYRVEIVNEAFSKRAER